MEEAVAGIVVGSWCTFYHFLTESTPRAPRLLCTGNSGGPHWHEKHRPVGLILYIPHRDAPKRLFTHLLKSGLQALENLKLDLGLSNVLLATAAAGDLLSLRNLVLDGLSAEVLKSVTLNSVDAELGAGLDGSETARDCSHARLIPCP